MTIENTVNGGITHSGNDSATNFSFPFKVNESDQVEVIIRDANDDETVLSSNYTVNNPTVEGSGSVDYPDSGDPLATGKKITIQPKMDYLQETDLRNQGRFAPETHEDAFDTAMMHIKELRGLIDRSIKFKVSSELTGAEFGEDPVDNRVIAWDGVTGNTKNVAAADIDVALVSTFWEAIIQDNSGDITLNGLIVGDPGSEDSGININGTTYESTFKVSDIDGSNYAQTILHRHSTTLEPLIIGARSNDNTSSHTAVTASQNLFSIYAAGYAGTSYKLFGQVICGVDSSGTISNTSAPGRMEFKVTPDGSITPATWLSVNNAGNPTFSGDAVISNLPGRNLLINGQGLVANRGTTFTSTSDPANSDDTYLLDRMLLLYSTI